MFIKSVWITTIISLACPFMAMAQDDKVAFAGLEWRVAAKTATLTNHMGREALGLTKGRIWVDDAQFTDGVISFSAAYPEHQVFIGAGWRADGKSHQEEMYFRGHLNNKPDSLQYMPVENGLSAWQIFSDLNSIGPVSQKFEGWNDVKIVVQGDQADIYFNSDEPVLHIPDLKTDLVSGGISLRATGRQSETVYFSNVIIKPLADGEEIVGKPKKTSPTPEGLIENWQVSSPFPEQNLDETLSLTSAHSEGLIWTALTAETNGIANLAKVSGNRNGTNTVFVRMKITSDKTQMKEMLFGYSDRVRIYLNGKRVYYGDAGWRKRDYRFLGTVGFFDSVGLDLEAGDNELLVGVSETFGGWAWAGAIKDRGGISLEAK